MKTKLITEFVCIATSGTTADGRYISADHLREMAESYSKDTYTAQIWLEHYRYTGNAYGQVEELKAEEQAGGKVKLFARLAPSKEMIAMNQRGIGLFTSIEITPKFSDTEKAYLTGLAITDSPASLGTTKLQFSKRIGNDNVITGQPEPLQFYIKETQDGTESTEKEQARKGLFAWLFGSDEPKQEKNFFAQGDEVKEKGIETMTEAEKQAFAKMVGEAVATTLFAKQNETETATEAKKAETVTISKEEYNTLKAEAEKNSKRLDELEQKFALATQEKTPTPKGAGGANPEAFSLDKAI
ncbi:GPO family capsid scaffolding protein [Mannheimia haemolytica]